MVLFSSYVTRLIKLSKKATAFAKLWIRVKPGRMLRKALNDPIQHPEGTKANMCWRLKQLVLGTICVLLRASFDTYESTLWEVRSLLTNLNSVFCDLAYTFIRSSRFFGWDLPLLEERIGCFMSEILSLERDKTIRKKTPGDLDNCFR